MESIEKRTLLRLDETLQKFNYFSEKNTFFRKFSYKDNIEEVVVLEVFDEGFQNITTLLSEIN